MFLSSSAFFKNFDPQILTISLVKYPHRSYTLCRFVLMNCASVLYLAELVKLGSTNRTLYRWTCSIWEKRKKIDAAKVDAIYADLLHDGRIPNDFLTINFHPKTLQYWTNQIKESRRYEALKEQVFMDLEQNPEMSDKIHERLINEKLICGYCLGPIPSTVEATAKPTRWTQSSRYVHLSKLFSISHKRCASLSFHREEVQKIWQLKDSCIAMLPKRLGEDSEKSPRYDMEDILNMWNADHVEKMDGCEIGLDTYDKSLKLPDCVKQTLKIKKFRSKAHTFRVTYKPITFFEKKKKWQILRNKILAEAPPSPLLSSSSSSSSSNNETSDDNSQTSSGSRSFWSSFSLFGLRNKRLQQ